MRTAHGFTLIEVLIAASIFTAIGIAAHSVLSTVLNTNALSSARTEQLEQLQRAMIFIERDLLQATPRAVRIQGEASNVVMLGGEDVLESDADGIVFVHAGWQNPQLVLPRSTLQAVGYRLRDNQLQRLYSNHLDNVVGSEPKEKILLEGVDNFQVEFYVQSTQDRGSNNDLQWEESYQSTELPGAVAIEIDTEEFGLIRREFLLAGQSQ